MDFFFNYLIFATRDVNTAKAQAPCRVWVKQLGPERDQKPLTPEFFKPAVRVQRGAASVSLHSDVQQDPRPRNGYPAVRFRDAGELAREFTAFKEFFHKKTGVLWRERMTSVEGSSDDKTKDKEKEKTKHKFEYIPPVRALLFRDIVLGVPQTKELLLPTATSKS